MVWYNRGKHIIMNPSATGVIDPQVVLLTDTIKVALMKTTYSIDIDAHEQFNDVSASEIVATSYTSRGGTLASKTITRDDINDRIEFDAADLTFSSIGGATNDTFNQIVIIRETPTTASTDANTELIAHTTVTSTSTNGGDITLVFDAQGLLQLS